MKLIKKYNDWAKREMARWSTSQKVVVGILVAALIGYFLYVVTLN